jgi:hypothetical protein
MANTIKRGDNKPTFVIACTDGGAPADLSGASSVRLIGIVSGQKMINRLVGKPVDGLIPVALTTTESSVAGTMKIEVETIWPDGSNWTFPGDGFLELKITADLT